MRFEELAASVPRIEILPLSVRGKALLRIFLCMFNPDGVVSSITRLSFTQLSSLGGTR